MKTLTLFLSLSFSLLSPTIFAAVFARPPLTTASLYARQTDIDACRKNVEIKFKFLKATYPKGAFKHPSIVREYVRYTDAIRRAEYSGAAYRVCVETDVLLDGFIRHAPKVPTI